MSPSANEPFTCVQGASWAGSDELRTSFTQAMSAMYKTEVPLYEKLIRIVHDVNLSIKTGTLDPRVLGLRFGDMNEPRVDTERHGAIRLGTAEELGVVRRVFALLGLFPVGYYDLSEAGLPMHATCFRPITSRALRRNPFRVFTSVLRPELVRDGDARDLALELLGRRRIVSDELMRLLDVSDLQNGHLTRKQGDAFITEALNMFRWQGTATATADEYRRLMASHPILADIACFATAHINHLTPRTLDITAVQEAMERDGLHAKERIEGPPRRRCPVLLRQTSFLAIEESIRFRGGGQGDQTTWGESGSHRARFGEIEERGAAVTAAGRQLYDSLTHAALLRAEQVSQISGRVPYEEILASTFEDFPDDWEELRRRGLVYFTYRCATTTTGTVDDDGSSDASSSAAETQPRLDPKDFEQWPVITLDELVASGTIEAVPLTYEDFLPLSAVGIFQSNLGASGPGGSTFSKTPDQNGMEAALGARVLDPDYMYSFLEQKSIEACSRQLEVRIVRTQH